MDEHRKPAGVGCLWAAVVALIADLAQTGPLRAAEPDTARPARPNILLAIADDWGWPHAGAYGDAAVATPAFDRLAREGVLFRQAFVSAPSCTPSRGAILTGQWHWRLDGAANLWSVFPDRFETYPEILARQGYFVGSTGKGWSPGRAATPDREPAGKRFADFAAFLTARPSDQPFCFWLGGGDPHRPYTRDSADARLIARRPIEVPACLPDHDIVRRDLADYYAEVQRFDALVGVALRQLEARGELDQTLVVVTSDNGFPFPRGKANLYDRGTRVPLALRWPPAIPGGRKLDDLVSLTDLAPTFLELAGVSPVETMTGRSLSAILASHAGGQVDPQRTWTLVGKERHVPCQETPEMGGYPCRGLRTASYLYVRNFFPDRWPSGTPDHQRAALRGVWLGDCDNGPTKKFLVEHQADNESLRRLYELAFGKRPAEELYDLANDPQQLTNVAASADYAEIREQLAGQLDQRLRDSRDPRVLGNTSAFDQEPYLGSGPRFADRER